MPSLYFEEGEGRLKTWSVKSGPAGTTVSIQLVMTHDGGGWMMRQLAELEAAQKAATAKEKPRRHRSGPLLLEDQRGRADD